MIDAKNESLVQAYDNADIFILTSKSEAFGRTAVEAMSRKCVVFGTRILGLSDVIKDSDYLYSDIDDFGLKFQTFLQKDAQEVKEEFFQRYKDYYS